MRISTSLQFAAVAALIASLSLTAKAAEIETGDSAGEPKPAADKKIEAPADESAADGAASREAMQRRFLRFNDQENYADALVAANKVVELTRQEFGPDSDRMIAPLTNLATTQIKLDELEEAEVNYVSAIKLIEIHDGYLSPRIVNPLIGLGGVYNRTRQYEQAVATFDRALRTNHVGQGFTNTEQFEIRDGLTESYIGLQENEEANFHQETQLEINRRRFGSQSAEAASAYTKLGGWYARSGQAELAVESYGRADRIFRNAGGDVLYERIASLEAMAQLYQKFGQLGTSSSILRRALEIVDAHPEQDFPLRARVLVDLGDLYTIFNKVESAGRRYREAWSNLSGDDDFYDERGDYFDKPVRVAGQRLNTIKKTTEAREAPRSRVRDGYVLIGYTVTPVGRVRDFRIIESEPPGEMDTKIESIWRRSKFRPRYVDGQPVVTENLLLRHDFQYAVAPTPVENTNKPGNKGELEYPGKTERQ